MARFAIVTTPELGTGFRLAGAEVHLAAGAEEAQQTLDALLADAEVGVIGVHAAFLDEFDQLLCRQLRLLRQCLAQRLHHLPGHLVSPARPGLLGQQCLQATFSIGLLCLVVRRP